MVKPIKPRPLWQTIVGLIAFFLHYTGLLPLNIGHASPLFFLPLLITVAMEYGETIGLVYGLTAGLLLDGVTGGTVCFNTLFLTLTGVGVGLLTRWLLNGNLPGAATLSVLLSALYYGLHWLIFLAFPNVQGKIYYLLQYTLPGAFYTSLLIFPCYGILLWRKHRLMKATLRRTLK